MRACVWYGRPVPCELCTTPFSKKEREQRFCSKKCGGIARRRPPPTCKTCGVALDTRSSREFCSSRCGTRGLDIRRNMAGDGIKTCTKCATTKPFSDFSPHKLGLGGVRSICKPCSSRLTLDSRANNRGTRASARRAREKYDCSPHGSAAKADAARRSAQRNPAKHMLIRARSRCKKSGAPFLITDADIVVPGLCPVFGIPMVVAAKTFREPGYSGKHNSMSLDRIDPSKGYVPGNVAVISWRANNIKGTATLEELEKLVAWLRRVTPRRE